MLRGSALGNILGQDKWIADIDATNVKEVGGKKSNKEAFPECYAPPLAPMKKSNTDTNIM